MNEVMNFLRQPEFYAALLGVVTALRVVGEAFIKIGELIEGKDVFETSGNVLVKIAKNLGKFFAFLGIGNSKK